MIGLYHSQPTVLHRLPAGLKLSALLLAAVAFLSVSDWRIVTAAIAFAILAYLCLGWHCMRRLVMLRPLLPLFAVLGALQLWFSGFDAAALTIGRLLLMILLADLVTMSTSMQQIMDALEPLFSPMKRLGLRTERFTFSVSLVIRLVPSLLESWRRREEAWRARTGRRPSLVLIRPFLADVLRNGEHIAEALDARGFAPSGSGEGDG